MIAQEGQMKAQRWNVAICTLGSGKKSILHFALAVAMVTMLVACGSKIPIGGTGINITEVIMTDRFPPDCEQSSPMCTIAGSGSQYLVIWLDSSGTSDINLCDVTDSNGTRYKLGGGLASGKNFLAQMVSESSSGFILHCANVDPISLGK
jgi:hypothetical protein